MDRRLRNLATEVERTTGGQTLSRDLEVLLRSRIPIVVVESRDESQVIKSLLRACANLPRGSLPAGGDPSARSGAHPLFQWTVTDGLRRLDLGAAPRV